MKSDLVTDRHSFGNRLTQSFWATKVKELKCRHKIIGFYAAPVDYSS